MQRSGQPITLSKKGVKCGPVVKNSPASAVDTGSVLGQGTKIPHAIEQLSPQATTGKSYAAMKDPTCHSKDPACYSLRPDTAK